MNKTLILFISIFYTCMTRAQGCGDAGACSLDFMKGERADTTKPYRHRVKAGISYGIAQYGVHIYAPYTEYTGNIGQRMSLSLRLGYGVHQGGLTTTSGLSDLYVSAAYRPAQRWRIFGGFKLPFNRADKAHNGLPLPMAYQTSLGTLDLIAGLSCKNKNWKFSAAWQKPLIQNHNNFLAEDYPPSAIDPRYLSTNGYRRSSDILLRLSRNQTLKNQRFILIYSLLPIFHLGNDRYLTKENHWEEIPKSSGLTLNTDVFLQYKTARNQMLEISLGVPVISRQNRPDGLVWIAFGMEYSVWF